MSTAPAVSTPEPVTLDISATPPTPFSRLVKVEWRKMIDTRSGFWLLAITVGLLVLTFALNLLIVGLNDIQVTFQELVTNVWVIPVSILVPVFAVLIVTTEWSQRTALTTFTLEPHRMRLMFAKLVAVSALAISAFAIAVALAALANVVCGSLTGLPVVWDLGADTAFWTGMNQLLYFFMGYAVGMLLLNTPGAIALYYVISFVLPAMVWSSLYFIFDWARDVLPWIDLSYAMMPLMSEVDPRGDAWDVDALVYVRVVFTALLFVVLPLVLGAMRLQRAEVK